MKISGYKRECDGTYGIRNHVLILPASICASDAARIVSQKVEQTVTFHNHLGCSQSKIDTAYTLSTMAGMAANPNVYGVIVISLGCENCQMDRVVSEIRERTKKPIKTFIIQEVGGITKTIDLASKAAYQMVQEAKKMPKTTFDLSRLIIGTECGGSDPTSGLVSNALVGKISDRIVDLKGTSILSETTEFIGAQHILKRRAVNSLVADRIDEIIERYEESQRVVGDDIRMRNPSPGNQRGGITTLEEKSLGCIKKSGTAIIQNVFDYAQPITQNGLVIMDTPGNDSISMMGMVAGGSSLILFTTGQGTPLGNPLVPVIKITANQNTAHKMADSIDFDASAGFDGQKMDDLENELFSLMIDVCNGKKTKSEIYGICECSIVRVSKYVKDGIVRKTYF